MPDPFRLTPAPGPQEPTRAPDQLWLEWAAAEWREVHLAEMTVRWARDVALIKPLLRQHGDDEIKARWRAHVRTADEYLARKGWNVPSFVESIDRYLGDRDRVAMLRTWNERQPRPRDPLARLKLKP